MLTACQTPHQTMKNSFPHSVSIFAPFTRQMQQFLIRGNKYIQVLENFQGNEVPGAILSNFAKKVKKAKIVRTFRMKTDNTKTVSIKPAKFSAILKAHSHVAKELDVSTFARPSAHSPTSYNFMKNLQIFYMDNSKAHIKTLKALRAVNRLSIDIKDENMPIERLQNPLCRLRGVIKNLTVLSSSGMLDTTLEFLDNFAMTLDRTIDIQVLTKETGEYKRLPKLSSSFSQSLTKFHLQSINSSSLLISLFNRKTFPFANLKNLKLDFSAQNSRLVLYLKHLENIDSLEKLFVSFSGKWTKKASANIISTLRLPQFLKELRLNMPLSLERPAHKGLTYTEKGSNKQSKYPWRVQNVFEEDPFFASFFEIFQCAEHLEKIELECQMLEKFKSYYTNFFISILQRLPRLLAFAMHAVDHRTKRSSSRVPEMFDLPQLLAVCSEMRSLEEIEVAMPNLLFEDAVVSPNLTRLREFNIGVSGEEEKPFRFENIEKGMTCLMKSLVKNTPDLTCLIFDFREVIDEVMLSRRFALLEKFKNLEYLCISLCVKHCNEEIVKSVGRAIQTLKKLNTIVLRFYDSDKSIFEVKTYLKYRKDIQDMFVTVDELTWISDEQNLNPKEQEEININ